MAVNPLPETEPIVSSRFYCPDPPREGRYRLGAEEARHLARVCRHVPGDHVEIFDGNGFATVARIVEIDRHHVDLVAEGEPIAEPSPPFLLTLATALPKGDRLDWLVEKATEIGVDSPHPPCHRAFRRRSSSIQARPHETEHHRSIQAIGAKPADGGGACNAWAEFVASPPTRGCQRSSHREKGCRQAGAGSPAGSGDPPGSRSRRGLHAPPRKSGRRPKVGCPSVWQATYYESRRPGLAGAAILLAGCEEQDDDELA